MSSQESNIKTKRNQFALDAKKKQDSINATFAVNFAIPERISLLTTITEPENFVGDYVFDATQDLVYSAILYRYFYALRNI